MKTKSGSEENGGVKIAEPRKAGGSDRSVLARVGRRLWGFRWVRRTSYAVTGLVSIALLAYVLCPKPDLYPPALTFSRALLDRDGRVIHLTLAEDARYRLHTPLTEISPALIDATLLLEDRHFHAHPGVNPLSLGRASWGVVTGTRRGGASTVTMQLARLRYDLNTRSFSGKFIQMLRALQIERHYSKQEILEAYLNLAPYGGNVEGIGAASLLWCGKSAKDLTPREAVSLSVLPQSPTRRRPKITGNNDALASAQFRLWQRWQEAHGLRADGLDATFTLQPETKPPREVPHLARRLFADTAASGAIQHPPLGTTIDLGMQKQIESALRDYLSVRREVGMTNACALLLHAPSREVLAYVGSASFLNMDISGQVDGVTARRSPGSALKPFIYALALQQGLLHPRSLLRDGQVAFGDYNPENFDREFTGPISAEDALFRSRNIPAVALTRKLAEPGLYGFLKQACVSLPRPPEHYGLSLPLGGAEVSMEELASMYAMLATDGIPRPLRYSHTSSVTPQATAPLLTPEACFLVRRMLASREEEAGLSDPTISWKTGTSHGFRDAWAAGIRGEYVCVVWIGNFNGKSNPSFIARKCAAPLLFEIFHRLRLPWHRDVPPEGVREVQLCAVSGQIPTPHCQHCRMGWFIPGKSPIAPCEIHREVLIDDGTGLRVIADDGRRHLRREVYEFWPPDLLALFRQAGVPRREAPPLEPSAMALRAAKSQDIPRIVSPQSRLTYSLRVHDSSKQVIPLRAETSAGVRTIFWFAGAKFLGSSTPAEPLLWKATAGSWKLHVLDDHGRSSTCEVKVEMVE
jgi:penicillin-binding protein 1C